MAKSDDIFRNLFKGALRLSNEKIYIKHLFQPLANICKHTIPLNCSILTFLAHYALCVKVFSCGKPPIQKYDYFYVLWKSGFNNTCHSVNPQSSILDQKMVQSLDFSHPNLLILVYFFFKKLFALSFASK